MSLDDEIDIVAEHLTVRGARVAVAESATTGAVLAALGSHSGASAFLAGGVVAYDIDAKVDLLGVDRAHAADVNCVSDRVASEMAAGVRRSFAADLVVATTGYLEPDDAHGITAAHVLWVIDGDVAGRTIRAAGRHEDPGADRSAMRVGTVAAVVEALAERLDAAFAQSG